MTELRCVDVSDEPLLRALPPCADTRFDHRTCDYWEDADRGSKAARPQWLALPASQPAPVRPRRAENPFARDAVEEAPNPLLNEAPPVGEPWNPFAAPSATARPMRQGVPRKLALLDRGRGVSGSYARVLLADELPVAYAQFGPLSAYPRAGRLRELYPQLPDAPLPAVITCVATAAAERGRGYGRFLVEDVCRDLSQRGFAAVEAYPDLTRPADETSAARPGFWTGCGFVVAVDDDSFPVLRRELE